MAGGSGVAGGRELREGGLKVKGKYSQCLHQGNAERNLEVGPPNRSERAGG